MFTVQKIDRSKKKEITPAIQLESNNAADCIVAKSDKMLGKPKILFIFANSFNKFNNAWALLLNHTRSGFRCLYKYPS